MNRDTGRPASSDPLSGGHGFTWLLVVIGLLVSVFFLALGIGAAVQGVGAGPALVLVLGALVVGAGAFWQLHGLRELRRAQERYAQARAELERARRLHDGTHED